MIGETFLIRMTLRFFRSYGSIKSSISSLPSSSWKILPPQLLPRWFCLVFLSFFPPFFQATRGPYRMLLNFRFREQHPGHQSFSRCTLSCGVGAGWTPTTRGRSRERTSGIPGKRTAWLHKTTKLRGRFINFPYQKMFLCPF